MIIRSPNQPIFIERWMLECGLSAASIGAVVYCLSQPEGWLMTPEALVSHFAHTAFPLDHASALGVISEIEAKLSKANGEGALL